MKLDSKEVMAIWNGQFPEDLFHNLKILGLECFHEHSTFPSHLLERFPNLEMLEVSQSSFETIFPWEGRNDHCSRVFTHINQLRFENLSLLKYIWNIHGSLFIYSLNLKKLAPSSLSFQNLTILIIYQCDGLVNLVTSSMARNFVQLKTMRI